jgi:hypothetical protein
MMCLTILCYETAPEEDLIEENLASVLVLVYSPYFDIQLNTPTIDLLKEYSTQHKLTVKNSEENKKQN